VIGLKLLRLLSQAFALLAILAALAAIFSFSLAPAIAALLLWCAYFACAKLWVMLDGPMRDP